MTAAAASSPARSLERLWPSGAALLRDGATVMPTPAATRSAVVVAFVTGIVLGYLHLGNPIFSVSLPTLAVLAAVGGLGGRFGAAAWFGYVVTDAVFYQFPQFEQMRSTPLFVLALIICYGVLAQLVVQMSPLASGLRQGITRIVRPPSLAVPVAIVLGIALPATLAYLWTLAAPVLIRPLATWQNAYLPTSAVQPLQTEGWVVVMVVAFAGAIRSLVEREPRAVPITVRTPAGGRARWITLIVRALVITIFLSGIIDSFFEGVLTAALLVAAFAATSELHARIRPVSAVLRRIPLVVRLAVAALVALPIARAIYVPVLSLLYSPGFSANQGAYLPVLVVAVVTMVLVLLLVPEAVRRPRRGT